MRQDTRVVFDRLFIHLGDEEMVSGNVEFVLYSLVGDRDWFGGG